MFKISDPHMNKAIPRLASKIIVTLLAGSVIFTGTGCAHISKKKLYPSQCISTPEVYTVTNNRIEIYNATTNSWVLIYAAEGNTSVNIASPDAEKIVEKGVEKYLKDKPPLPKGVYTKVRFRNHRTFKLKGSVHYNNRDYYTTSLTSTKPFRKGGRYVIISEAAPAQEGTFIAPSNSVDLKDHKRVVDVTDSDYYFATYIIPPFTVTEGSPKKLRFDFDVTNKLFFDIRHKLCWPGHPNISVALPEKIKIYRYWFSATPDIFKVIENKAEVYNSTIGSWILIYEGKFTVDAASPEAGKIVTKNVEEYLKNKPPLPEGIYTKLKIRINKTVQIKGKGSYGGKTYYTTTHNEAFFNDGKAIVISTTGPAQIGNFIPPLGFLAKIGEGFHQCERNKDYMWITFDLPSPFIITKDSTKKLKYTLDVNNKLFFDLEHNICAPQPPNVYIAVK